MSFGDIVKEFFGWKCDRPTEGFLSWQHLLYVTVMVVLTVALAVVIGRRYRGRSAAEKDRVMKSAAVIIVCCELLKIVILSFRAEDAFAFRGTLPLFLCSMNLFTIPIAAFARGRMKEFAVDCVFMYGMLCCIAGTYLAANYFDGGPVLRFDSMMSVTTHCVAGFASLYAAVSGIVRRDVKKFIGSLVLIVGIEGLALLANVWNASTSYECNYMFLSKSAGTPFEIVNTIVGGKQAFYTVGVAFIYVLYGLLFTLVYALATRKKKAE